MLNHSEDTLTVLHFDSGAQIETTSEHPFYVDGKGWVAAGQLGIGTSIVTRAGPSASFLAAFDTQAARVVQVEQRAKSAYVYNLIIAGSHTYFVGDGNDAHGYQWVHNGCGNLGEFAKDIHGMFPAGFAQWRSTVGAARALNPAGEIVTLVGGSGKYLSRLQQGAVSQAGAIYIRGFGRHAEANILEWARQNGYRVLEVGASRGICNNCHVLIKAAGATAVSALR